MIDLPKNVIRGSARGSVSVVGESAPLMRPF